MERDCPDSRNRRHVAWLPCLVVALNLLDGCVAPEEERQRGAQVAPCRTKERGTPPALTPAELDACWMINPEELQSLLTDMDSQSFRCRESANASLQGFLTLFVEGGDSCDDVIARWREVDECIAALQTSRGLTPEQSARVGALLVTLPDRCSGTFTDQTTCPDRYEQIGTTQDLFCIYDGVVSRTLRNYYDDDRIRSARCDKIVGDPNVNADSDVYVCTCELNPVRNVECTFDGRVDGDVYRKACGEGSDAPDGWRHEVSADCRVDFRLSFDFGGISTESIEVDADHAAFGAAQRNDFRLACNRSISSDFAVYDRICQDSEQNPIKGPWRYLLDVPCCKPPT